MITYEGYLRLWERTKRARLPGLRVQFGDDAEDVCQEAFLGRVAGLWSRMDWQGESACMALMSRCITRAGQDWRRKRGQDERLVHAAPQVISIEEADAIVDLSCDLSSALVNREELLARLSSVPLGDRVFVVAEVVGVDPGLVELLTGATPSEQKRLAREGLVRVQQGVETTGKRGRNAQR
jgi:DNA-directed RNA polymerase specialized sigma24 family protein